MILETEQKEDFFLHIIIDFYHNEVSQGANMRNIDLLGRFFYQFLTLLCNILVFFPAFLSGMGDRDRTGIHQLLEYVN